MRRNRGRPLKPAHERYDAAGTQHAVYLAEIGDMLKVGHSRKPTYRLIQLHQQHARKGETLGRFRVFPTHRGSAERECIEVLAQIACTVPGHIEYFTGLPFDEAEVLLQALIPA